MASLDDAYPDAPAAPRAPAALGQPAAPAPAPKSIDDEYPDAGPKWAQGPVEALQAGWQNSAVGLMLRRKLPDLILDREHSKWWERTLSDVAQIAPDVIPIMLPSGAAGTVAGAATGAAITGPGAPAGAAVGGILGGGAATFGVIAGIKTALMDSYKTGEIKTAAQFWDIVKDVAKSVATEGAIGAATFGAGGIAARTVGKAIAPGIGTTMTVGTATKAIGAADVAAQIAAMTTIPAALQGRLPDLQEIGDATTVILALKGGHMAYDRATRSKVADQVANTYVKTGKTPADQVADAQANPDIAKAYGAPDAAGEPFVPLVPATALPLRVQSELFPLVERVAALESKAAGEPAAEGTPAKPPEPLTPVETAELQRAKAKIDEIAPQVTELAKARLDELATKAETGQLTDLERTERVFLTNNLENTEAIARRYNVEIPTPERRGYTAEERQAAVQRVHDEMLTQLREMERARKDAGLSTQGDEYLQTVARLAAARVRARAERTGVLADELYRRRPDIKDQTAIDRETEVAAADAAIPEGAPTFKPPEVDLFGNPIEEAPVPRMGVEGLATVEVPLKDLRLSEEVPQFKKDANAEGVIVPLGGKFDRTGVGPIQVWERRDGTMEVISGRHRLDLARRSGEETIPAQIHREADGFTAKQAALLDAELNIREEQGSVADYAQHFKASGISRDEADARGLLARAKGRAGFAIARDASPDLLAAHSAGLLSDEAALSISNAAPGSERLQALGIAVVNDGKSILMAVNMMKSVEMMAAERMAKGEQGDMFGFDDSAMRQAEMMAKKASARQRKISEQISAVSGASRRPELARKMGVDVQDPEAILAKIAELKQEQYRWDNWPLYPELVAKLRNEDLAQGPVDERAAKFRDMPFDEIQSHLSQTHERVLTVLDESPDGAVKLALFSLRDIEGDRGKRLGNAAMEDLITWADTNGRGIKLFAQPTEGSDMPLETLVRLYEKYGFTRAERQEYSDAVAMYRDARPEEARNAGTERPEGTQRRTGPDDAEELRAETPDPAEYSLAPETPAELRARDAEAVAQAQRALQQERAAARAGGHVKVDQADLFNTQNTLFQEPARSEEIPEELSLNNTLYHGSRSKIEGLKGIVYLTTDPREAAVFARGEIPGTGRADRNAPPTVYETASNGDIRVKDIDAIVQDEIMSDGDIDPLIRAEVKKAAAEGYGAVGFLHPSGVHGGEFAVIVPTEPARWSMGETNHDANTLFQSGERENEPRFRGVGPEDVRWNEEGDAGDVFRPGRPHTEANLIEAGIPEENIDQILRNNEPQAGKQPGFDVTPAMKEKAMAGLPLFQQRQSENRGAYDVAQNLIRTLQGADKSTIVHELGHSWLEEMKADAARPDAPAQIKADWEIIRRELAIPESGDISRASHEQWARTIERFLGEGEAPSIELRGVFERFKTWLLEIYKDLRNLNVTINPEFKGVLDRLLATDEEIAAARDLNVPRQYVEIAKAEEGARIVPPPEVRRKIEPGFAAEQHSMQPFADELPPGPGEAPDNIHVNYAYINTPTDVKLAMQRMAEIDQANIQRQRGGTDGKKSWAQANAEQAAYLNDILGGGPDTLKLLQPRDPEAPGVDVRLGVLKKLAVGAAEDSARLRDELLAAGHDATVRQQLEYMGSIERARMIQAEFLGERASVARALNALKDLTQGSGEIGRMLEAIGVGELHQSPRTPAEEQAAMKLALDQIMLNYKGKTPLDIARLHKEIGTLKGTFKLAKDVTTATTWEKLVEGWRSGLLSGPVTHTTNLFGTGAFQAMRAPVDALAALIGMARGASVGMGETDRASMSESVARLTGMIGGIQEGLKVGYHTFMADEATGKAEAQRTAIEGYKGRLIRTPLRLMGAEDAMISTMYKRGELRTLAWRQAFDENLNPGTREFGERVQALMDHPTDEMAAIAEQAATRMAFNMPLGEKGVALQSFVAKWNLQWMIPFIRTPINIAKELLRMSPFAPAVGEWRAAIRQGGVERDRALAEIALGTAIMAVTMSYAFDGQISGAGSPDPGKNRAKVGTWQPYSILIGDTWYEYARIQPTGTLMGMAADIAGVWEHMTDEEKDKAPKMLATAFANAITNQTFLQGITNVVRAMSEPDRFAPSFLKQFAASTVPNIVGQPTTMADPVVREVNGMLEAIQARLPGLREQLLPKRDWLGEPVETKERLGVVGPVREQKVSDDKVRQEADRLDISVAAAPKKLHVGKGTGKAGQFELTPEERDRFEQVGGQMAHKILANVVSQPGYDGMPDMIKRRIFAQVLTASHKVAAVAALPPEKRQAYLQQAIEKVQGELQPEAATQ